MKTRTATTMVIGLCLILCGAAPVHSQEYGACCLFGFCQELTEAECLSYGGTWVGGPCGGPFFCPPPGGTFVVLFGIAADGNGNIYTTDLGAHNIQKFTSDGVFQLAWGGEGSGDGEFILPRGIATDHCGNVYVLEGSSNYRVQKFYNNGTFLTKWGSHGTGDMQFENPLGIGVDASGNVYITDSNSLGERCVKKFDCNGTFIAKWGAPGTGDGEFQQPYDVAADSQGNLFVSDFVRNTYCGLQKFDSAFNFITRWSRFHCTVAYSHVGLDTDASGNLYVIDKYNNRVQKFDNDGNLVTMWGSVGIHDGEFKYPDDLAVDANGYIYVADTNNSRIQKFTSDGTFVMKWGHSSPTPIQPSTWGGVKSLFRIRG